MTQTTDRLKCNPPLGRMPVLQFVLPGELQIDPTYQRQLDDKSQTLIRRIAQHWNWDLCQPLVVSRRHDGTLYVIDGQHRLCAARLRGDIAQLPCVVVEYANAADEAASFVTLNQQRKALSKMDLFKAAIASGDSESCAIVEAMNRAGLSIAPYYNPVSWKPGMVANIGGMQAAWRREGPAIAEAAMAVLKRAYPAEALCYAGTIYPGLVAVCSQHGGELAEAFLAKLVALVQARPQHKWRGLVNRARGEEPNLSFGRAAAKVFTAAWTAGAGAGSAPVDMPPEIVTRIQSAVERTAGAAMHRTNGCSVDRFEARAKGKAQFCDQCECLKSPADVAACGSPWCTLKKVAEAAGAATH